MAQRPVDSPAGPRIQFAFFPPRPSETARESRDKVPVGPGFGNSVCSLRHAACLHASPRVSSATVVATLASIDRAWDVLTGALALPEPDTTLDGAWHTYLVDAGALGESDLGHGVLDKDAGVGGGALPRDRDPRAHFDSATSFGVVDPATPVGCPLDFAAALAVARACLWRAVPATDDGSARAQAESLARLAVPCAVSEADREEFQSHPERTLVDPSSSLFDGGASLFFEWLDATFAREPGGLVLGLWALAPTRTSPDASHWSSAPTAFDVLRESLKGALLPDSTLDDVFVRFAVYRAQVHPAVRLAWQVGWPLNPRRLASPEPVSPSGASYVLVEHAGALADSKLRLEAQWEDYGRMRWVVVKLDAAGRTLAVMPVTSLDRGTRASLTVESLEGVDRILIVGVNVGSTEHPFHPDQGEWEPHGWLLTLAAE